MLSHPAARRGSQACADGLDNHRCRPSHGGCSAGVRLGGMTPEPASVGMTVAKTVVPKLVPLGKSAVRVLLGFNDVVRLL